MSKDRKPPTPATVKKLFALSGNQCAFPKCTQALVDEDTVFGEIAHIVAAEDKGPRADDSISQEEKRSFDNLILLCSNHHKTIDRNPDDFSVPMLKDMKSSHERKNKIRPFDINSILAAQILEKANKQFKSNIYGNQNTSIQGDGNTIINFSPISYNRQEEQEELSIIDEIIQNVIKTKKLNLSEEEVTELRETFNLKLALHIEPKIKLNFKSREDQYEVSEYFKSAYMKIGRIEKIVRDLASETYEELYMEIFSSYRKLKRSGLSKIQVLTSLIESYIPEGREKHPSFHSAATGYVLFFFDDCSIFDKTIEEQNGVQTKLDL